MQVRKTGPKFSAREHSALHLQGYRSAAVTRKMGLAGSESLGGERGRLAGIKPIGVPEYLSDIPVFR